MSLVDVLRDELETALSDIVNAQMALEDANRRRVVLGRALADLVPANPTPSGDASPAPFVASTAPASCPAEGEAPERPAYWCEDCPDLRFVTFTALSGHTHTIHLRQARVTERRPS